MEEMGGENLQRFQIYVGDEYLLVEEFQFIFVYLPAGRKRDDASTNTECIKPKWLMAHPRARARARRIYIESHRQSKRRRRRRRELRDCETSRVCRYIYISRSRSPYVIGIIKTCTHRLIKFSRLSNTVSGRYSIWLSNKSLGATSVDERGAKR